jgi:hypothetical protein
VRGEGARSKMESTPLVNWEACAGWVVEVPSEGLMSPGATRIRLDTKDDGMGELAYQF